MRFAARISMAGMLLAGCGDSGGQATEGATGGACMAGHAGCACSEDGLCLSGLACVDKVCVEAGPTTGVSGGVTDSDTGGTMSASASGTNSGTATGSTMSGASDSASGSTGATQTSTEGVASTGPGTSGVSSTGAGETTNGESTDTTAGDTTAADTTDTGMPGGCGDGVAAGDEACDGLDLAGETCVGLGYKGGKLACAADCTFDEGQCTNSLACGDALNVPGVLCFGPAQQFDNKLHYDVFVGEVTGDAHLDVVTLAKEVRVRPGDGKGGLGAAIVSAGPVDRGELVDVDGDGELDVVAVLANALDPSVSVMLGDGAGKFVLADTYDTFEYAWAARVGDVNGDGLLDLAVGHYGATAQIDIRLGKPGGKFGPLVAYAAPEHCTSVGFTDVDLDGQVDLWAGGYQGNFMLYPGHGDGTFELAPELTKLGGLMAFTAPVHLNGDPYYDIVSVLQVNPGNMRVRLGDAMGFAAMTYSYPTSEDNSFDGVVLDIDGDEILDVVAPLEDFSGYVDVFRGDGTGLFYDGAPLTTAKYPRYIAAGDLNEDGLPDLATTHAIDQAKLGLYVTLSNP
jgi:hypothetical protein